MIKTMGAASASFTLYLPNPPTEIPPGMDLTRPDIAQLTELNGNHWRKIFTILAKLAAPNDNWREYRDQQLLKHAEQINFGDALEDRQGWHLVAGKASWQRLGFTDDMDQPHDMQPLDENGRIYIKDRIVLVPYPDYRQLPNQLIEQIRVRLHSPY
ncbi:hypothetical protein QKW35_13745 [Pontibacterium granulatum]|uniref:DUF6942 family protein n=1 Tax=Pontibacterium granulatum TaxID=2036029 RepID=UPI00249A7FBE|nr:hypothetical protein [Pontibacterium granulatum]MDI3325440.1 hypothetical protein [Pontibacterium granulatum]